jgi:hypothetical protein
MTKKYQTILSEELKKLHMKGKSKTERQNLFKKGVKIAKEKYDSNKKKN